MSVTELPNRDDAPPGGYGLTPPQDVAAEQSVLGAMLLSKDAIADVVEVLRGHDFYRPAHEVVYDAVLDLYGRGEPADAVMVASTLQKTGDLGRVGGAPYLHTLVSSVPSAANAGYYANIVRERAILRRLVEAGTRITQMGYGGDGDADDIVDRAQAEVYSVTDRRASEDYAPLSDIMEGALDEIEAIGSRGGEMVGVPTGFADLDSLTNGLHPGQMVIVAARPAVGKALALDTPLPTPTGWATMGEVSVGDLLIGADGKPTQVVAATDVMDGRPCYEVEFSDGSVIVADAQHQWATDAGVVTTEDVAAAAGRPYAIGLAERFVCPSVLQEPPPAVRTVVDVRPVTSVPVRCVEVDAADHLYLAGPSCIPTHNSTLGLDVARAASIRHQLASVIFSLEMSRNEITMRLLSAEAKVPLHHMRAGQMTDDDWNRIARSTGEVSSAPLFIDDSPNMTMMEIRAKCRRLRQRHDLRLVIVDYLQLMTSGKKVESRQQEVSEFSRSLKLLAKELEVPVIAICQLNRGPEQRTDKKPMLSDLRESGCVPASTRILRADTGAEITIGELMASGTRDIPVWSLDDSLRYVPRTMTHAFPSGRKETFRVYLASGKHVDATAKHPFLTYDGWTALGELGVGSRVAVPRHVPAPLVTVPWADAEVIMLAQSIGEGSHEKFIPDGVFSLPKRQIALFLRHLWATDGSVTLNKNGRSGQIYYCSTSRELIDGVSRLLLRFGISTRLAKPQMKGHYRPQYMLFVSGRDEQLRFLREIGCHGQRGEACDRLLAILEQGTSNPNVDTVPRDVWQRVRTVLAEKGMSHRQFAKEINIEFCGSTLWKHGVSRERLGRVAAVLDDAELEMYATNDILWDRVVSIESIGEQDVFDATVLKTHNFVANGIALHNSLEQDADMVVLLHREDAYEKESPRAGEADFIVAKHRNGPTATITVAFQGHYSRFVDMAQ